MDFGNDFVAAPIVSSAQIDPATEFFAQKKSILGNLDAEIISGSRVSKTLSGGSDAGILGGDINELDASSSSDHESSTSSFEIIKSKRQDYLHQDDYFMAIAVLFSKRSKDPLTQEGAVIVNEDNRIEAIGCNSFTNFCDLQSIEKDFDPINDKEMFVVHAEANAILNIESVNLKNARLYTTLFPCIECAKLIERSGISKILYMSDKYADKPKYQASRFLLSKAKIECLRHIPLQKKIVIDFEQILETQEL